MFVGEEGDSGKLVYHVEGEGLTLTTVGSIAQCSWQLFLDASWDMKYLYNNLSLSFDPFLATHFFSVLHVHGSGTDVDVSNDKGD